MVKEKYVPPQPTEFHDNTLLYLDELRQRRKQEGVSIQAALIDKVIKDKNIKEYDKVKTVRERANILEQKAKRDELVLMYAGDMGVDREMEVNDMYLDAISAKLKLLDKI